MVIYICLANLENDSFSNLNPVCVSLEQAELSLWYKQYFL